MEICIYIIIIVMTVMATLAKTNKSEAWIGFYIFLALLVIGFTAWQQKIDSNERNETRNNIEKILEIAKASEVSKENLKEARNILSNPQKEDLKSQASHISAEAFVFLEDRRLTEPQDIEGKVLHFFETTLLCNELFGNKLADLSDKLRKNGRQDSELDKILSFPLTPTSTHTAGTRLKILSESMP